MKLSSLFVTGTIASSVLLAGTNAHGQSVEESSVKPTRLPQVSTQLPQANTRVPQANTRATLLKTEAQTVSHHLKQQPVQIATKIASPRPTSITVSAKAQPWLRSTTAMASSAKACEKLEQAKVEFHSKAWLSAEQSAWESISLFSQAIDLQGQVADAGIRFRAAKDAVVEARDFGGSFAATDPDSIVRLAKSHRTNLITGNRASVLTSAMAIDRYLDHARRNLAPLAAQDVHCAEAIDFLAAIYLARDEPKQLPGETALCLRRAALQGQPANADLAARLGMQLADVGLVDEASWAMEHSLQIQFEPVIANRLATLLHDSGQETVANQWREQIAVRSRFREGVPKQSSNSDAEEPTIALPMITQLTPSEFASVSMPVMQGIPAASVAIPSVASASRSKDIKPVSFAPESSEATNLNELNQSLHTKPAPPAMEAEAEMKKANPVRRWFQSIKKPW